MGEPHDTRSGSFNDDSSRPTTNYSTLVEEHLPTRGPMETISSHDLIEKQETQNEAAAKAAKKEELAKVESELTYPTGLSIALIMISLYLAIFLIAIVSNGFSHGIAIETDSNLGPNHHSYRYSIDNERIQLLG